MKTAATEDVKRTLSLLTCILLFPSTPFAGAEDVAVIKAGEFVMGDTYCAEEQGNADWCDDESPHKVRLDRYMIDKYEVTNADYNKCFAAAACGPNALHEDRSKEFKRPKQPVTFVTWEDAANYCQWKGGRLPSEAEWEKAALGNKLGGAHFGQNYNQGAPMDVGQLESNSAGLFDMMGNVYEWTLDSFAPTDAHDVRGNPMNLAKDKVVRGGAWHSRNFYLRPADRVGRNPLFRYTDVGFRCANSLP